ncbi:MAG: LysM peptidoglycan-binding domain-containing protein [Thermodesulfobacteriota bacterium]
MRNAELARGRLEPQTSVAPTRPAAEKPRKRREPLVLVILGLLVLAVLLIALIARTGDPSRDAPYKDMDSRIQRVEQRLVKMEGLQHRISKLEQKTGEYNLLLMDRMDRIEKALSAPKEQKAEEKRIAPPRREGPVEAKQEPSKPVTPPKEAKPITYHQVLEGETLYRISRNYGLSVDELLRMNNLAPGSTIRKGQKLRVGPP